jgi:hypothetical protein
VQEISNMLYKNLLEAEDSLSPGAAVSAQNFGTIGEG